MLKSNAEPGFFATAAVKRTLWGFLILAGSVGFSFVFACATPFAALATLAALNMPRRDVFAVVGFAWLANQVIGYGLLGYPQTWDSFAWGGAIGIGAGLGAWAAAVAADRTQRMGKAPAIAVAFLAACLAYQAVMYVSGLVLPGGGFSLAIVETVLMINAGALLGLLVAYRAAVAIGLVAATDSPVPQPAAA
jgi:hypothetical protein